MSEEFYNKAVKIHWNKTYDSLNDKKVDIYEPPPSVEKPIDGHPVVFYIHGGAYHVGYKESAKNAAVQLAKDGYVVASAEYSLSNLSNEHLEAILIIVLITIFAFAVVARTAAQMMLIMILGTLMGLTFILFWAFIPREKVTHPQHISDVATAFKFVHDQATNYNGNPNKMYVMGHSAGGGLGALLCTNESYLEKIGLSLSNVKACIGVSGVYSDKRLKETTGGTQLLKNAFGDRKTYYSAFAIYNVSQRTPPFLLVNAGFDITLKRHAMDMHYALRQEGVYSEIVYFNDRNHFNIMKRWSNLDENNKVKDKIVSFMKEVDEL